MRILQVSANYPPKIGGPASSVPQLSALLAKQGHEVQVITQKFQGYKTKCFEKGFFVHRAESLQKNPAKASGLESLSAVMSMSFLVRKISKEFKPQVIHAHDLNISSSAAVLGNCEKVPIISKYTGDLSLEYLLANSKIPAELVLQKYSEKNISLPLKLRVLDFVQKKLAQKSSLISCPSIFQQKTIISQGIPLKKTVVLRNAVDLKLFDYKKSNQKKNKNVFSVLFSGRLVAWKGVSFLLEGFSEAAKQDESLRLIIIGDGPERERLEELSKNLGINTKTSFLGKIKHEQMPEMISSADLFALPSIYDPFPHGMLECLAMKKPILATNVCGIPEVIKHKKTGYLVEPSNPEALYQAITELSENNSLRKRLAKNGFELVSRKYSWESCVGDFINAYKRVLEN